LSILTDSPVHDAGTLSLGGLPEQKKRWAEVMDLAPRVSTYADKKHLEWLLADLMEGYSATTDMPSNLLVPQLLDVFPDAVVIATTRDASSWHRSTIRMTDMTDAWYVPLVVSFLPGLNIFPRWKTLLYRMVEWRFGRSNLELGDLRRHEDWLREVVPKEKLFFYNCRDGWEPLCKILHVPVPDRPFPHNNKPEEASKVFTGVIVAGIVSWLVILCVGATGIWGLCRYIPRSWM
jgi:hypothetical protein